MTDTVTIPSEVWKATLAKIDALAAENARFRKASFVTAVPSEQYERVIKAGDAVTLCLCADTAEQHKRRCAVNWLAAKEGRDAK